MSVPAWEAVKGHVSHDGAVSMHLGLKRAKTVRRSEIKIGSISCEGKENYVQTENENNISDKGGSGNRGDIHIIIYSNRA
jgi:hypothetical protein